jgi:hypothetical protein
MAAITAGTDITLAGSSLQLASLTATGAINVQSGGSLNSGTISGGAVTINAGSIATSAIIAGNGIALTSTSSITTGTVQAGGAVAATGSGAVQMGAITAGTDVSVSGNAVTLNTLAGRAITATAAAGLATGAITASGLVTTTAGLGISLGAVQGGGLTLAANGPVLLTTVRATDDIRINAGSGAITATSLSAADSLFVRSTGAITTGSVDAGTGGTPAGLGLALLDGGSVSTGAITTFGSTGLLSAGGIGTGTIASGGPLVLLTGGAITTASLATPATGTLFIGNISQRGLVGQDRNGNPDYAALLASAAVRTPAGVTVTGTVNTGLLQVATNGAFTVSGAMTLAQGGTLNGQSLGASSINAGGPVTVITDNNVNLGALNVTGGLSVTSNGPLTTGNVTASGALTLLALPLNGQAGNISTGNLQAGGTLAVTGNGSVSTGSLTSTGSVRVLANATTQTPLPVLTTGAITAGTGQGGAGSVFLNSAGSVVAGNITARGAVVAVGVGGPVTTGSVNSGAQIVLLDPGGITTGPLTTPNTGAIFIANHSQLPQITFDNAGDPQVAALLASTPVRLDGFVRINGQASTGQFISASTLDFTAQGIAATQRVVINTAATANLNGNIGSPQITITSGDVALASGIQLNGNAITLNVDGTAPAFLGGTPTANSGWRLSGAEWNQLRASSITVSQASTAGLTVGALTLNGSTQVASQGQTPPPNSISVNSGGVIRVNGALAMANAASGDRLSFNAGRRFELNTDTGSITLGTSGDKPTGNLAITSPAIWVGTSDVLGQLGSSTAPDLLLNAPASTPLDAGQLIAGSISFAASASLYVQNSGTLFQRAGFSAGVGGVSITSTGSGPLDVIINGRALDETGTFFLTNRRVLPRVTLLGPQGGTFNATLTSTINGCPIVGVCPSDDAEQAVNTVVNNVGDMLAGEDQQIEILNNPDADTGEGQALPVVVTKRLMDVTRMFSNEDVDEPATGSGNPALWLEGQPTGIRAPGGLK